MATTIDPEADPTFLAYERARQAGESTLKANAARDQLRNSQDRESGALGLTYEQENRIDKNTADYRSTGFGQSGIRAEAEDRIRRDIALKMQDLLRGYQRTSEDITSDLEQTLAQNAYERAEQELAARNRLTQDNAKSGVGI